ncbi:MAG TPA: sulfur transferase domain-containing protein [Thermoanaerobaculia bacterium]
MERVWFVGAAIALALSWSASAAQPFGIANESQPEKGLLASGQPTQAQLQEVAKAGYKTVIDLRTPAEDRGFDEPAAVREAGMSYVSIPVTPVLDAATLDQFIVTMKKAERPIYLHCATSNRVGALYYAWLVVEKGMTKEEALEKAKATGLRSPELTEKVKALVDERQAKPGS